MRYIWRGVRCWKVIKDLTCVTSRHFLYVSHVAPEKFIMFYKAKFSPLPLQTKLFILLWKFLTLSWGFLTGPCFWWQLSHSKLTVMLPPLLFLLLFLCPLHASTPPCSHAALQDFLLKFIPMVSYLLMLEVTSFFILSSGTVSLYHISFKTLPRWEHQDTSEIYFDNIFWHLPLYFLQEHL